MQYSRNRLEVSLRSVKLKLQDWPEILEIDLDEMKTIILTGINGGGKTLTMKLIMDYCDLINSHSSVKSDNFQKLLKQCGVEYFSLKFGYDWFDYNPILSPKDINRGSKIPWLWPRRGYVDNQASLQISWDLVSRTTSIKEDKISKNPKHFHVRSTIFCEHIITGYTAENYTIKNQNDEAKIELLRTLVETDDAGNVSGIVDFRNDIYEYEFEKVHSMAFDCKIHIQTSESDEIGLQEFEYRCVEEESMGEPEPLYRVLSSAVDIQTYGPSVSSSRCGVDFEWDNGDRYARSQDWLNPKIHPQFIFNTPTYLTIEDAYDYKESNLNNLQIMYDFNQDVDMLEMELLLYFLRHRYEGRLSWMEENSKGERADIIDEVCDCPEKCNYLEDDFQSGLTEKEYRSYEAVLTLFDYELNILDLNCLLVSEGLGTGNLEHWVTHIIEDECESLIHDENWKENNYVFTNMYDEDISDSISDQLSDYYPDFGIWWAIKEIIPYLPDIPSSGQKRIIGIFSKLCSLPNKSSVVFIDEPELSLHIDWQEEFVDILLKSFPKMKFILATHAPNLISNHFDLVLQVPPSESI